MSNIGLVRSMAVRVVHVVRQFYPGVGGVESYVRSIAQEQLRQGHSVSVVTLDRVTNQPQAALPAYETLDGVAVHRIGFRGSSRYPIAPGVLRHLKSADVVHVHCVDFFCDFLAVTRFLHRKPLVISTHGGFFHTTYAKRLKRLFFTTVTRLSLRGYRRVFACSDNDLGLFQQITDQRLMLIPNGVDTAKFAGAA